MSLTANVSPRSGPCDAPFISTWAWRQNAPIRSLATISFTELMERTETQIIQTRKRDRYFRFRAFATLGSRRFKGSSGSTDRGGENLRVRDSEKNRGSCSWSDRRKD